MALDKPLESSSLHGLNYMLKNGQVWFIDLAPTFCEKKNIFFGPKNQQLFFAIYLDESMAINNLDMVSVE